MVKIVFDHLPKCGGTSVRRFLAACVGENRVAPPLANISVGRALRLFEHYDVISGHFYGQVLVHAHPDVRYITLLRHPVDRIVSAYHFLRLPEFDSTPTASVKLARSMSLKDYVSQESGPALDGVRNNMSIHFATARGAHVSSEDILAAALANIMRYDVIGILDDMPGFFSRVCRRFGWSLPGDAFQENKAPDRPSLDAVDPEVRAIIEANNSLDIALYDAVCRIVSHSTAFSPASPGDVGDRDAQHIASCSLRLLALNGTQDSRISVASGDHVSIRAEIGVPTELAELLSAIIVLRDAVEEVVYTANSSLEVQRESLDSLTTVRLEIDLTMRLAEGQYTIDLYIQGGQHTNMSVGVVRKRWVQIDIVGYRQGWFAGTTDLEARWGVNT